MMEASFIRGYMLSHAVVHQTQNMYFHVIIKLYCHIQRALHNELECSLALTHMVPIFTIKMKYIWQINIRYKHIVHNFLLNDFFKYNK